MQSQRVNEALLRLMVGFSDCLMETIIRHHPNRPIDPEFILSPGKGSQFALAVEQLIPRLKDIIATIEAYPRDETNEDNDSEPDRYRLRRCKALIGMARQYLHAIEDTTKPAKENQAIIKKRAENLVQGKIRFRFTSIPCSVDTEHNPPQQALNQDLFDGLDAHLYNKLREYLTRKSFYLHVLDNAMEEGKSPLSLGKVLEWSAIAIRDCFQDASTVPDEYRQAQAAILEAFPQGKESGETFLKKPIEDIYERYIDARNTVANMFIGTGLLPDPVQLPGKSMFPISNWGELTITIKIDHYHLAKMDGQKNKPSDIGDYALLELSSRDGRKKTITANEANITVGKEGGELDYLCKMEDHFSLKRYEDELGKGAIKKKKQRLGSKLKFLTGMETSPFKDGIPLFHVKVHRDRQCKDIDDGINQNEDNDYGFSQYEGTNDDIDNYESF